MNLFNFFCKAYDKNNIRSLKGLKEVTILTTPHTLYVAYLLENLFATVGIKCTIETELSSNESIYIVICPQVFHILPRRYIAFQMEQTTNKRWFTKKYFSTLNNSICIFDYSERNILNLKKSGKIHNTIFYIPICYSNTFTKQINIITPRKKEYDLAFYGDPNTKRRKVILDALKEYFSINIISNQFGKDLYKELYKAKAVLNIHYYENALLETTRIYECLSLGIPVISEEGIDQENHHSLEKVVKFAQTNNISDIISKTYEALDISNLSYLNLNQSSNKTSLLFYRMLLDLQILSPEEFYHFCKIIFK